MTQLHKGCVYDLLQDCSIRPYLCPMLEEFQRAMDPFSFKSQSKIVSKPQLQPQQKLGLTQLLICITITTRTKSTFDCWLCKQSNNSNINSKKSSRNNNDSDNINKEPSPICPKEKYQNHRNQPIMSLDWHESSSLVS